MLSAGSILTRYGVSSTTLQRAAYLKGLSLSRTARA